MIKKVIQVIKKRGFSGLIKALASRIYRRKAKCYSLTKRIVSSGCGLEIGGLSPIFQKNSILPIYSYIDSLDNCNFSQNTVWEGDIRGGLTYTYDEKHEPGRQFLLEATDLNEIKNDVYDFLLSSHMIEHTANPIKALKEWMRVVKTGGHLILLIPHKNGAFDHHRPVTTLEHLIKDSEDGITEKDLTHLDEILKLHDLSKDLEAGTHAQFHERSKKNYENRCLHHHVFDVKLAVELIDYVDLKIKAVEKIGPLHILIIAQKPHKNVILNNSKFLDYVTLNQCNISFALE